MKDFAPALKHIADIIERGIREHPELSVGMQTEGIEVREKGWSGVQYTRSIPYFRVAIIVANKRKLNQK